MHNFFNQYQLSKIRSSTLPVEKLAGILDISIETIRAVNRGQDKPAIRGAKSVGVAALRTKFLTAWQTNKNHI